MHAGITNLTSRRTPPYPPVYFSFREFRTIMSFSCCSYLAGQPPRRSGTGTYSLGANFAFSLTVKGPL